MARYIDADRQVDQGFLEDWYISSVMDTDELVWTEEHIKELVGDYIVIPRTKENEPTADVVEVIRCHNCEYHGIRDKCPLLNMSPYRDDERGYCSEGKRLE